MNNELFERANAQYKQKDFQGALIGFTDCLQDAASPLAPGEMGLLYHRIGNCLVKLKNPAEAIQSYTQATADASYAALGTVECNLGMAYASLRDYDNAVAHFERAVADEGYDTPHKAYMGMGNALLKLGKSAEAGVAFREAALDEGNPDPTKALLNLGVCFMALNRPADAVASYESALQFDMTPDVRNKMYASLGQAYVACGQMEQAVEAFERAIADKTYFLSDSASVDYQRAVGQVAQGTSEMTQVLDLSDISGLDVAADGTPLYADEGYQDPFYYDEGYDANVDYPGYVDAYQGDEDRFFNASEEEIEQWSKGLAKQDRKRRNVGLKILVAFIIVVVLAFAGVVFAYTQGFGYPSQETVAKELFADPEGAKGSVFASGLSESSVNTIVDQLVTDSDATVDGVNRSMSESTVYVTAHHEKGGEIVYEVSMVRDMIGWKVSNAKVYNASQN
ncbi:MAG: tetratricopeptide repeat protein [Eggerthellaceae bacterium]|nr:tetratricopeptide repeat protein [Eggerthellaceae bacterium]